MEERVVFVEFIDAQSPMHCSDDPAHLIRPGDRIGYALTVVREGRDYLPVREIGWVCNACVLKFKKLVS